MLKFHFGSYFLLFIFFFLVSSQYGVLGGDPLNPRYRPVAPMMLKAYSTTDIPRNDLALTPVSEQKRQDQVHEKEDTWAEMLKLYYARSYDKAIEKLETLRVKRSDYFITQDNVAELPFSFNHALLHLALYEKTRRFSHLSDATMDIRTAIMRCRHFYPSYIAEAQIYAYKRDLPSARRALTSILEILQFHHQADRTGLIYDGMAYKGSLFIADIIMDLALIEGKMGVLKTQLESRFNLAYQILKQCEEDALRDSASNSADMIRAFFRHKRSQYYAMRNDATGIGFVKLVSLSPDLLLLQDSNDVGYMTWIPMEHLLRSKALEAKQRKRSSSGLTRMVDQIHRRKANKRTDRERQESTTPSFIPPPPPPSSLQLPSTRGLQRVPSPLVHQAVIDQMASESMHVTNVPIMQLKAESTTDLTPNAGHGWRKSVKDRFKSFHFGKNRKGSTS